MRSNKTQKILLTFDIEGAPGTEDFIDSCTLKSIHKILKLLEKYHLKGLFFISGNVIEKVSKNRDIFQLLRNHKIGFHSSSHSVKPRICEYSDLPDYNDAMKVSIERESSSIDPFTGEIIGSGGILSLREHFPEERVESFRTPFNYFSPPHIEALRKLGIRYVFSGDFSENPVSYKGLTFFPDGLFLDGISAKFLKIDYLKSHWIVPVLSELFSDSFIVFILHPSQLCYKDDDTVKSSYCNSMYPFCFGQMKKSNLRSAIDFSLFRLFVLKLNNFQKAGLVDVDPCLEESKLLLDPSKVNVQRNYQHCLSVASLFGYKPRFLLAHFNHFLGRNHHFVRTNSSALKS
jgi:hypothetical protein